MPSGISRRLRVWLLAASTLCPCLGAPAPAADGSLEHVRQAGVLKMGGESLGGAPYAYVNPDNPSETIGFEIDMGTFLARELGVRLEFKQTLWTGLIPALLGKKFDMAMSGLEITEQRAREVAFTKPYFIYGWQLIAMQSNAALKGYDSLRGATAGCSLGTAAERWLRANQGRLGLKEVRSYTDNSGIFIDLKNGRLDAAVVDTPMTSFYGKEYSIKEIDHLIEPVKVGIAVRKQDQDLLAALNAAIERMISSGEQREILAKWSLWERSQALLSPSR